MWCVILYFDFSWMWCCAAPVWRNMIFLWLLISFCLQLEHFGFSNFMLSGSSWLPVWSIFLCMFYCSTLMHHVFSNLHEPFLLRSIAFWLFEADAVLCVPSFQLDIIQVLWFWCVFQYFDFWWIRCAAPIRWNMIFMIELITRSAHKSNFLLFGRLCFWVPLCFNLELLRSFSKMMFYWFSVLHLGFPFLLDN